MTKIKRDLHYVDPSIRKSIIAKVVFYWSGCLVFLTLPLIIGTTMAQADRLFVDHFVDLARRFWPLYLVVMGILPFAIRDFLRLTNRTLGPLKRLRRELDKYKTTGSYHPIQCREDDFLKELVEDINQAILSNASAPENAELTGTGV